MVSPTHRLPGVGALRFPTTRSRMLLFFVAMNFVFLGLDTALAHWIDRTIKVYEWIPVIHGPIAGLIVLWMVFRPQPTRAESVLLLATLASALAVGLLGSAFHWQRALLARGAMVDGPLQWLVFAPPAVAPMAFAGIALVGLMATMLEEPFDSGRMTLWGWLQVRAPISKTRQLLWLVGLGYAAAAISAILDHARSSYANPAVWIAVASGIFATAVTIGLALMPTPRRGDLLLHIGTQVLMIAVGVLGFGMHLSADLTGSGQMSVERLINFAPAFAPLLFTNLAVLGLISVLQPAPRESA